MICYKDFEAGLRKALKIPITTTAFDEIEQIPLLIINDEVTSHGSDRKIYYYAHEIVLELFHEEKSDGLDSIIQQFLNTNNLKFVMINSYISAADFYQSTFTLTDLLIEKTEV